MDAREQRLWDLLARALERTVEDLAQTDFPTHEHRISIATLATLAAELSRPCPIALDIIDYACEADYEVRVETLTPGGRPGPWASWQRSFRWNRDRQLADVRIFLSGAWIPLCREYGSVVLPAQAVAAMRAIAARGSLLGRQLADEIGSEEKNLLRAIKSAVDRGLIVNPTDKDGYRLSPLGAEWVRSNPDESDKRADGNAR
jgi:hypothetical protein